MDAPWALKKLPAFPPIATRLLRALSRPEEDMEEIASLIAADPALATEVLRIVNSSYFGLLSRVASLQHAVAMLGTSRVKSLATAVCIMRGYLKGVLKQATIRRVWQHSLACAFIAEDLSAGFRQDREEAYAVGLMHDIGRLGLLVAMPKEYSNLIDIAERDGLDLLECERELFELDHCQAGQWLARQWNLPEMICTAAATHHQPPAADAHPMMTLAYCSCLLAEGLGFAVARPPDEVRLQHLALPAPPARKPQRRRDFTQLRELVQEKVQAFGAAVA